MLLMEMKNEGVCGQERMSRQRQDLGFNVEILIVVWGNLENRPSSHLEKE